MLTTKTTPPGRPTQAAAEPRERPRKRSVGVALLQGLLCVAITAQLVTTSQPSPKRHAVSKQRADDPRQYVAGGTRWLDSRHQEVVHFICQGGTPYIISLDSASLRRAGAPKSTHPRFLEALREAVQDWAELISCDRFRVELDSPYPNTRIAWTGIDAPGTLATATRAGDISLNVHRAWFPGSKKHGNYSSKRRLVSFYWVVAHELGHVWGLAHSDRPDALMYPTQCSTCRWSSFEQAAGNVIRAASRSPRWSRPHYANRSFAKTPINVIGQLLSGDLPDDIELTPLADSCESATCESDIRRPGQDPEDSTCGAGTDSQAVALQGWQIFRTAALTSLADTQDRLERGGDRSTRRPPAKREYPDPIRHDKLLAVDESVGPGRGPWRNDQWLSYLPWRSA
ncbi:MAG: matrixin family metalloprotease [bacterium]